MGNDVLHSESSAVPAAEDPRLTRLLTRNLPLLAIAYVLSFIDPTNIDAPRG